jgi:CheY-like chemotaxis protein
MKKVLIVEDDAIIAKDIGKMLESQGGISTDIACFAEDAIEKTKNNNFDLLIMDIVLLGRKSGVDAAFDIRKFSDVPILFITAYNIENLETIIEYTQPSDILSKPFKEIQLLRKIESILHEQLNIPIRKII